MNAGAGWLERRSAKACRIASRIFLALAILLALVVVPVIAVSSDASRGQSSPDAARTYTIPVTCRDSSTGTGIAGVRVYLDGEFRGVTAGKEGRTMVSSLSPGEHTVRAVGRGYRENTSTIRVPQDTGMDILMHPSKIVPIGETGPVEDRIDIVFVPSKTQYDCTKQQKIVTDYYTTNEDNFRKDVDTILQKKFLSFDTLTTDKAGLPTDFRERFNFYYYSDPGDFADAFKGCAGTLPEDFWEDAPFTDAAIIIYPAYNGFYTGPPCEPNGCSSTMGPGVQAWMKCPANFLSVCVHEAGHVVFGLMDTYCGETYYAQNDPSPNVWSSMSACTLAAANNHWDPSLCRQIVKQGSEKTASCSKEFWRYDPEPDLMGQSLSYGKFGSASTSHIRYILDNINRWKL